MSSNTIVTLQCVSCGNAQDFPAELTIMGQPVEDWFLFQRSALCKACYPNLMKPLPVKLMARITDPPTSHKAAKAVVIRAGTQRHVLLGAYSDGSELTADEAMRKSGASPRSCYWKRISELREAGFIENTGEERTGESGSLQMVCRITAKGTAAL